MIPYRLERYRENTANFVTYYGDIYPGYIYEFQEITDRFYIIPRYYTTSLNELRQTNKITTEELDKIGWGIKDHEIIVDIIEDTSIGIDNIIVEPSINGRQLWSKMFVFGAGASAHCVPKSEVLRLENSRYRPPEGAGLFNANFRQIIENYSGVKLLLSSLKRANNDVEAFLESEWGNIRDTYNPSVLARHISIIFYLQQLFCEVSNEIIGEFYDCNLYSTLIDNIQKDLKGKISERVAFVNFNYDTILDHYIASHFRQTFENIDDYINYNSEQFLYFKPHGSSNWGWKFKSEIAFDKCNNICDFFFNESVTLADIYYRHLGNVNEMVHKRSWAMDKKYTINKNKIEIIKDDYPRRYFPSILIPYRDKDEFVMPYSHTQAMDKFMHDMEDLFLIGWKGNEDKFNKLLGKASKLKRIIIVNPDEEGVLNNLSKYLGDVPTMRKKYEITHFDTFEHFVYSDFYIKIS